MTIMTTTQDIDTLTAKASKQSGIPETLIQAVLEQLGGGDDAISACRDITEHGIDGGFTGFVYTKDTVTFFEANRVEIVALAERMADDLGELPAEMVCGFNCLAGRAIQDNERARRAGGYGERNADSANRTLIREYMPSVSRCLYGGQLTDEDSDAANALAWFAGEEVARALNPDV